MSNEIEEGKEVSEKVSKLLLTWAGLSTLVFVSGCVNDDLRQRRELLSTIECPVGEEAYVEPPFYGCWAKKDLELNAD